MITQEQRKTLHLLLDQMIDKEEDRGLYQEEKPDWENNQTITERYMLYIKHTTRKEPWEKV